MEILMKSPRISNKILIFIYIYKNRSLDDWKSTNILKIDTSTIDN